MDNTSIVEERRQLVKLAQQLYDETRDLRARVMEITARMQQHADMMVLPAMDEITSGRKPKVHTVTYDQPTEDKPEDSSTSKRKCSICRQPGHRATTCSNGRGKR